MKIKIALLISAMFAVFAFIIILLNPGEKESEGNKFTPSDWFYNQRAYPEGYLPQEKYFSAVKAKQRMMKSSRARFTGEWKPVGPSNIGGRITALAVDETNNIIYAGAAAGGLLKSTDEGKTWEPKTDNFPSLSVGALKIDPAHPNIVYCGTGEANISTDSYAGFGMLKSTDFGETWFVSGLEKSRHIAEIEIHPLNTSLIYAAVSGGLYSKDDNRGIYKSTDAGETWNNVLFISDSVSAIDVAVDPADVNRVYAAVWERLRGPSFRKAAGEMSGIYISTDAGNSWNEAVNGLPVNNPEIGRISIAVAPTNPDYVYALYKSADKPNGSVNKFYGFYRSTDKGADWTQLPGDYLSKEFYNFGWYFGLIEVDPNDYRTLYIGDIDLFKSTDGGESWKNITNSYSHSMLTQHPDQHALWIDPQNPSHLLAGNDGGLFKTANGGSSWSKIFDLPISQFYNSAIDYLKPERKYGGTQDNGSMRTPDGSYDGWEQILGGDGFHCAVDYTNSDIIYAEYQNGGLSKSTDGGNTFRSAASGINLARTNWNTPFIIDPKYHNTLYLGSDKLYRTTNGASSWSAISPDLTRGLNGFLGNITAISAGYVHDSSDAVIYAGSSDAKVSVTTDAGTHWKDVTGNLPNRYITSIKADERNPAVAYVTLSGYNLDESNPHIFRTTDFGQNWTDISGNLPDVPLNSVVIDYDHDSVLYVGGDAGVYYTADLGQQWNVLGEGLPNSPVFDLSYHQPAKILIAATHGRSMFEMNIENIVTGVNDNSSLKKNYVLRQNYPNPFNPSTTISYYIPGQEHVILKIFDITGREVSTLINSTEQPGNHSVKFNGSGLASGIYFYKIQAGSFTDSKKFVLLK